MEALPDSCLRAFMIPSSGLPGLDPHRLCPASLPGWISRGGSHWRRFSFREIGGGNRLRLWPPVPAAPFLLQQLFNAALCSTAPAPGGILNLVAAIIVPLASLAGVTELATESLRSIVQPTAQKLLGGGCCPLLQALFAGLLLFDFVDLLHLPDEKKGRVCDPSLQNQVASICSMNLVDINLYSRVFFGKVFIKGTMVLPHLMSPLPESTFVI